MFFSAMYTINRYHSVSQWTDKTIEYKFMVNQAISNANKLPAYCGIHSLDKKDRIISNSTLLLRSCHIPAEKAVALCETAKPSFSYENYFPFKSHILFPSNVQVAVQSSTRYQLFKCPKDHYVLKALICDEKV